MSQDVKHQDEISTESGVDEDHVSFIESQKEDVSSYSISRPIYNQGNFLLRYDHDPNEDPSLKEQLRRLRPDVNCQGLLDLLLSFFPLLTWLPKYQIRRNLPADIAAGLTVGVMNIPQG